jgi:putative hydrolase of the HAD superfamily
MVGNSPKSDINPALRTGMYAVYIPYDDTWKLDNEPIKEVDGRFLQLERFADLKDVFI